MKKSLAITAACLLFMAAAALAGCSSKMETTAGGQDAAVINKSPARIGHLDTGTVISGKLEALLSANVVPKIGGKVASIKVDVGSEVAAGDLLLSLDAADLEALVDLNAAQLEKARNSDLPAQKNQAELNLANAEALFNTADADYHRYQQLLDANVISRQQFEQAEKQYLQAKASYEAAQNALNIMVNATIPETVRLYEAQLKKARADLANTVVKAPISGIITAKNINPGEMASPNQPVISIVNLDTVVVQANVNEDQVNKISVGQELKVKVSSVREEPFTGIITNIALAANPASKAFPVKIQVENQDHILKPGMFAEVFLSTSQEEGIIIPREALIKGENNSYVWVVADGQVSMRQVEPGQSDGKNVIIRSGLEEGEEVATTNTDSLKDGMKVNIQN